LHHTLIPLPVPRKFDVSASPSYNAVLGEPAAEATMPNIELKPYERPSMWRKMSFGNWGASTDPQVYGKLDVDMTAAREYAAQASEAGSVKVTPTHLVVRALALAMREFPEANVLVRWWRVYPRRDVDIFCQVAIPGEKPDLSGATIRNADTKDVAALARELKERAGKVRAGADDTAKTRRQLDLVPSFLLRPLFWLLGFLQYTLNLDFSFLGLPKDPFGGAMVTSIGSLGLTEAYPPLVPMSRVSLLIAVGRVEDRVVALEGQAVIRPMCTLTCTFDHRVMDGFAAGELADFVRRYLADPPSFESAL
jgi:pyruvate dehydrogenase E2 component (dihydrolipoamide acetyltransferase)